MSRQQGNSVLFFENLSLQSIVLYCLRHVFSGQLVGLYKGTIYYIDASWFANKIIVPFSTIMGIGFYKLKFNMADICDDNGELIRLRIHRVDLLGLQDEIIHSEAYLRLQHESLYQDGIIDYINKGLIDGGVVDQTSVARIIYIIEVVAWFMNKISCYSSIFVVNSRPWFYIYKAIAEKKNINLIEIEGGGVSYMIYLN